MTFTITQRSSVNSGTTAAGSQVSGSFTPAANSRLFVFAAAERNDHSQARNWTISNTGGLTFTKLDESPLLIWHFTPNYEVNSVCWYADVGGSPSSMTVTVDASTSNEYYALVVFDVTGYDTDTPFAQASVDNGESATGGSSETGTLTLGSAPASGNLVIAMFGAGADGGAGFATPTGYSVLTNQNSTSTYCQAAVFYHTSTTTAAVTCSDLGQSVGNWGGIIFEMTLASAPSPISGSTSATLGALTSSATGSISAENTGSLTKTLGSLTASSAGTVALTATTAATLGALTADAWGAPLSGACVNGVLTVNATNGRYFENNGGPLVLSGFHTWYLFQDAGDTDPPPTPDYAAWLDYSDARGGNFFKLWHLESAQDWADVADHYFTPLPWARTGPGNAADGKPKFDLDTWDESYFERLHRYAIMAGNRGYYVCVQLFQGWMIDKKGYTAGDPWAYHPMQAGNNINSVDGDTDNDGAGDETRTETIPAVQAYQEAYVERVLDRLNHLDNVLYEISNEDGTYSYTWQQNFVDHIHTYEAGLAKQHPVGLTVVYPLGNNAETEGNNEWLSYNATLADDTTDGNYVSAYDTDHTVGLTSSHAWVWQAFCNGHGGLWYMDEYDGALYGTDRRASSTYETIRYNLGYTQDYAARIDLAAATPQPSLASTGYCLANTSSYPRTYLAYQSGSSNVTVDVSAVDTTLAVEWLRVSNGTVQTASAIQGGAQRTLTPPWADAVLFLVQEPGGDVNATLGALTTSATGTLEAAEIAGATDATLGALTVDATAALDLVGVVAATLEALTSTATAELPLTSATEATLGDVALAAASTLANTGATSATLETVALSAAGTLANELTGAVAATLDALTTSGTGTVALAAVVTVSLADLAASGTGTVALAAIVAVTLADDTGTATGVIALVAATDTTLGALTSNAAGTLASGPTGSLVATLAAVSVSSAGTVALSATVDASLAALSSDSSAALALVASTSAALADLTSDATGAIALTGAVATTLADVAVTAAGMVEDVELAGTVDATLDSATSSGAATLALAGSTAATLESMTAVAAGAVALVGATTATLGGLAIQAIGVEVVIMSIVYGSVYGARGSGTVTGTGATGTIRG